MSPALKNALIISAKNAVNVLLTNTGAWLGDPHTFNVTSAAGWIHMLRLAGWVVLGREGIVWLPKILKWSTTGSNPS